MGIFGINSWKYFFVEFFIKTIFFIFKESGAASIYQAREMMVQFTYHV
ncbi:hypothetical protein XGA_0119 [Xanthomonas hortorum ATCC 19865]|nr:hypothetical protein XGA_0119 [Xanthomonas hortorum ATCC 19865]